MGKTAVVIGSNSFTGSHFVKKLLSEGYKVVGMSRSTEAADEYLPYKWGGVDLGEYQYLQADLNQDMDKISNVFREVNPEYVVNFASQSMVAESWDHPEHWYQTNCVSLASLATELLKIEGLKNYVHITTPEVYGSCSGLVKEDHEFNPSTPYAVSRAAGDMHLRAMGATHGLPVIMTRAANVYGPGQQLYRIVPKTMLSIKNGVKLPLHGGGTSVRSFIHVDDVCDGTYLAMLKGKSGDCFHLSTPDQVSIRGLVEQICTSVDVSFEECVEVAPERPGKDQAYLLDSAKANSELGWVTKVSLEQGLADVASWVNENYDFLSKEPLKYLHKA